MKLFHSSHQLLAAAAILAGVTSFAAGADSPALTDTPKTLAVGDAAPIGKGIDQNNKAVDLGALYKKGIVLVYFYPKAGTKGCTAEACSLRDAFADLTGANLTVVGISQDSVDQQKKFADDNKLPFSLVADTSADIYKAFLVPGRGNRESFLVKDGKIVWIEVKASTAEQANDVKKALATIKDKDRK